MSASRYRAASDTVSLTRSLKESSPLLATITAGQKIGVLKVVMDGKPYGEFPVVALEEVAMAGIFGRGWDSLRLLFK